MEALAQVNNYISYIKPSTILQNKQKAVEDSMVFSRDPHIHMW